MSQNNITKKFCLGTLDFLSEEPRFDDIPNDLSFDDLPEEEDDNVFGVMIPPDLESIDDVDLQEFEDN